jgi:hypothetical protein
MGCCRRKLRSIKEFDCSSGAKEVIHVIDVGCWQAEMYGCGGWLEAIKRKTVVCNRIKWLTFLWRVTITTAKHWKR